MVKLFFHAVEAVTFPTEHVFSSSLNVNKGDFTAAIHMQTSFSSLLILIPALPGVHKPPRCKPVYPAMHRLAMTTMYGGIGATGDKALTAIETQNYFCVYKWFSDYQHPIPPWFGDSRVPHSLTGAPETAMILSILP